MVNRMETRTLQDSRSHITQSIEAVKSLLGNIGRSNDPLPPFLELTGGRCILVLSTKRDAYYTVTPKACSCPSACFKPEQPCEHRLMYFPEASNENSILRHPAKNRPIDSVLSDPAHERPWKPPKPVFIDEILIDYDGPVVA
jgi:hypothetical protein